MRLDFAGDGVDVAGQRQGHDIGLEAVDHRARLLAGPAMGDADRDILAGAWPAIPWRRPR